MKNVKSAASHQCVKTNLYMSSDKNQDMQKQRDEDGAAEIRSVCNALIRAWCFYADKRNRLQTESLIDFQFLL